MRSDCALYAIYFTGTGALPSAVRTNVSLRIGNNAFVALSLNRSIAESVKSELMVATATLPGSKLPPCTSADLDPMVRWMISQASCPRLPTSTPASLKYRSCLPWQTIGGRFELDYDGL